MTVNAHVVVAGGYSMAATDRYCGAMPAPRFFGLFAFNAVLIFGALGARTIAGDVWAGIAWIAVVGTVVLIAAWWAQRRTEK